MRQRLLARIMPADVPIGKLPGRLMPLLFVAYMCLLPRELTLDISGAALFPYRLALILMAPAAIGLLARYPVRPSVIDFVALFAALWFSIALYFTTSAEAAVISGGANGIDLGFAYLVGRAAIRTPQDLRLVLLYLFPGLLALVAIMAAESLSHRIILRPTLASLLGLPPPEFYPSFRLGLLRAMGPFPHPILGGVFLAGVLPLAWYWSHTLKLRLLGCGIAMGAVFTMSASALLALMIGGGLIVIQILQRLTRIPVALIVGFYTLMASAAISVGSQNGLLSVLIRYLTLDAQSGFYRLSIWEYGGAEALAHPVFGIGQRDWTRPYFMPANSVDSYWLFVSMSYGIPAAVAVLVMMVAAALAVLRTQRFRSDVDRHVGTGSMIFLVVAIFCGLTVHFWENLHAWLILLTGGLISLATQARVVSMAARSAVADPVPSTGQHYPGLGPVAPYRAR